ncbi:hypothetical protein STEG23_021044, partial [Scotinomys teguina]
VSITLIYCDSSRHAVTSVKRELPLALLCGPSPSSYGIKTQSPESIKFSLLGSVSKEQIPRKCVTQKCTEGFLELVIRTPGTHWNPHSP